MQQKRINIIDSDETLKIEESNLLDIDWINDRANIVLTGQT